MVHNYLRLTTHLVSNSTWSQHATALQADPALQRAIADVLLGRCLPATAAAVVDGEAPSGVEQGTHGVFTLFVMASTVQHRAILSMAQRWAGTNGAAAACGQAAAILAAVPVTRPSSMPEDRWSCNLCSAAALLAACCSVLASQASHRSPAGQADEAAGRSAGPPAGHTAAALQLADLLPQLAAALAARGDSQARAAFPFSEEMWLSQLHGTCADMCQPVCMLSSLHLHECSPSQLSRWPTAATAALRLLPSLSWLDAQLRQHSSGFPGAADLYSSIISWVLDRLPDRLQQLPPLPHQLASLSADESAAWDCTQAQLWALHTSLCGLVAALSSPAQPLGLPDGQLTAQHWCMLQRSLCSLLLYIDGIARQRQHFSQAHGWVSVACRCICHERGPSTLASQLLQPHSRATCSAARGRSVLVTSRHLTLMQ